MNCITCQKSTSNPKFCSRSCAAIFNNKKFPKRKIFHFTKEVICIKCQSIFIVHKEKWGTFQSRKYCTDCSPYFPRQDWTTATKATFVGLVPYQVHSKIRQYARKAYQQSNLPKQCFVCGYSLHYEVCHKQSISSFSSSILVSEINSLTNLVALCPTHHWELDAGLLVIE